MATAKQLVVKVIDSRTANAFIKRIHYSGKVVSNSQLHFGVFLDGVLGGVMQYGPSTDKSKLIGLVEWTGRNEFIELNRLAFAEMLPKNSESRALAVSFRLIKKNAPHIKRIVSFADGCQCGDGTIYRASGFELTQIRKNTGMRRDKEGNVYSQISFTAHRPNDMHLFREMEKIPGFMLRYVKLLHPGLKRNYAVLPYSEIQKEGAGMYKGKKQ